MELVPDPQVLLDLVRSRMPFGKYKGYRVCDLPGAYLVWFSRQGFPRGKLGEQLRMMLELEQNGLRGVLGPLRERE